MNTTDIEKDCFRGVARGGWTDRFRFEVAGQPVESVDQVIDFFRSRKAELVQRDGLLLTFTRGRRIWTWFGPGPETWPLQTIRVSLSPAATGTEIEVQYDVTCTLVLRLPPFGLENEVGQMARSLCK